MKVESAAFIVRAVCMVLSFGFAFLSFQAMDDSLRRQFAVIAASPFVVGIVILGFLGVCWKLKLV